MSLPPVFDLDAPILPSPDELDVFQDVLQPADNASDWPDLKGRSLSDKGRNLTYQVIDRLTTLLDAWERTELAQGVDPTRLPSDTYGSLVPPLQPALVRIRTMLDDGGSDEAALADLRVVELFARLLVHWRGYPSDALVELLADETGFWNSEAPNEPVEEELILSADGSAMLVTPDPYFGGYPECGKNDGYLNLYKYQWMVCHKHQTCWPLGNMFTSYQFETEEVWQANRERLASYQVVENKLSPFWVPLVSAQEGRSGRSQLAHRFPPHPRL